MSNLPAGIKQINIESGNKIISIDTWRFKLRLNMLGTVHNMSIRDFRKMLTVVRNIIDPGDMAEWITLWNEFIEEHYDKIPRADKFLKELERQWSKLPSWIFEESL